MSSDDIFFIQESFRLRFDIMQKDINRLRDRVFKIEKTLLERIKKMEEDEWEEEEGWSRYSNEPEWSEHPDWWDDEDGK